MKVTYIFVTTLLSASLCFGQTAAQTAASSETRRAIGHGSFPVKITKTIDSSKVKEGDPIEVETAGSFKLPNGTLVPKGSKMDGHIVLAKARSKGDPESQLTILFDKLTVGSEQLPVKGTVQAVFPPPVEADPGLPPNSSHEGGSGAPLSTPEYKPTTDIKTGVVDSSGHSDPAMSPQSIGVQGIDNLELKDGVLISRGKNVKLGSSVRMIVRADIYK